MHASYDNQIYTLNVLKRKKLIFSKENLLNADKESVIWNYLWNDYIKIFLL